VFQHQDSRIRCSSYKLRCPPFRHMYSSRTGRSRTAHRDAILASGRTRNECQPADNPSVRTCRCTAHKSCCCIWRLSTSCRRLSRSGRCMDHTRYRRLAPLRWDTSCTTRPQRRRNTQGIASCPRIGLPCMGTSPLPPGPCSLNPIPCSSLLRFRLCIRLCRCTRRYIRRTYRYNPEAYRTDSTHPDSLLRMCRSAPHNRSLRDRLDHRRRARNGKSPTIRKWWREQESKETLFESFWPCSRVLGWRSYPPARLYP